MCETCGCSEPGKGYKISAPDKNNIHHNNDRWHDFAHSHSPEGHTHDVKHIDLGHDVLHQNNVWAAHNRGYFEGRKIKAFNLLSAPGSGKTSILEASIKQFAAKYLIYVIEGDQQTQLDALRISNAGAKAVQVNTGNGCHLDAQMVAEALQQLGPESGSWVFIENVGNLVCPALFDLGETKRIVITSVTEGDDKPLKYPNIFHTADLCIINKMDLLPYVTFNTQVFKENALRVNPHVKFIEMSATNELPSEWLNWLEVC